MFDESMSFLFQIRLVPRNFSIVLIMTIIFLFYIYFYILYFIYFQNNVVSTPDLSILKAISAMKFVNNVYNDHNLFSLLPLSQCQGQEEINYKPSLFGNRKKEYQLPAVYCSSCEASNSDPLFRFAYHIKNTIGNYVGCSQIPSSMNN